MLAFDASRYFTHRQSDARYVQQSAVTAAYLAGVLNNGTDLLLGSVLAARTVTGSQIADEAVGLAQMLGTVRPPAIVTAKPALPDTQYPVGSQIYLTTDKKLYINRDGADWEPTTRAADLSGTITAGQFAASIKPVTQVASLPTLIQDPITHLPTNYNQGDVIMLTATSRMYQLINTGGYNYVWDPVVKATSIDTGSGLITASQINVDQIFAGVVSSGALKTDVETAGVIGVDQLGANSATIDNLAARNIQTTLVNFTTLNGDTANISFLTAGMVIAGAITSDKLLIGSFDNLMEDGGIENPSSKGSWTSDGNGLQVSTGNAHSGSQSLQKSTATSSTIVNRMVFAVKGADLQNPDTLYLEGWAKAIGANGTAYIRVQYFQDRACTVSAGTLDLAITAAQAASWFYNNVSGTAPSGARWARAAVYISGQTAGTWSIDDLYVRTMVGQAYINSLKADVITTGLLNLNNLTVTGTMSANQIYGGTIDARNINVTFINGQNVQNATLGNAQLDRTSSNKVQITDADVSNLSAGKINAGTLNVGTGGCTIAGTLHASDITISGSLICNITGSSGTASSAGYATNAGLASSASTVPASGVGSGSLNTSTTITGNQITTGTLFANLCAVANINASSINTGSMDASRITARTITADRIAANQLTAYEIASRTITADRIAAGQITAYEISSSYVYAGTLVVSQIQSALAGQSINVGSGLTITGGVLSCLVAISSAGSIYAGSTGLGGFVVGTSPGITSTIALPCTDGFTHYIYVKGGIITAWT